MQPADIGNLWYFKLGLFDLTELIVWNIKGLRDIGFPRLGIVKTQILSNLLLKNQ